MYEAETLFSIMDARVYRLATRVRKLESLVNKLQFELEQLKEDKKDKQSEDKKSV